MRKTVVAFLAAATTAVAVSLLPAPTAAAAPDIQNAEDQTYMRLLDRSGVLFSFNLQKRQGQRYCKDVIDGATSLEAKEDLMELGGYSFDVANAIGSSAGVAYCICADGAAMGVPYPGQCNQFETNYRQTGDYY
jgi:hypothetical protein